MLRFRFLGIPVFVQPFFWLTMAFIGGGMSVLSNPTAQELVNTLVFVAAGFLSIMVHEYGHALTMRKFGKSPQIILHGMGGLAVSAGSPLKRGQNILVTLAGPLSQLLLGVIAYLILFSIGAENFPTEQSFLFIKNIMFVSVFWSIINLIPIHPLDGGQLLALATKNPKLTHIVGITIAIPLMIYCFNIGSIFGLVILGMLTADNVKAIRNSA